MTTLQDWSKPVSARQQHVTAVRPARAGRGGMAARSSDKGTVKDVPADHDDLTDPDEVGEFAASGQESKADEEIASYVARAVGSNFENVTALSAFQRRMDRYPQLSSDAQAELVVDYQRGVAAKEALATRTLQGRDLRQAHAAAQRSEYAIEHLIGSSFKLVWLIVRELAEERYGREKATDLLPDLMNEANVAVVESCREFDPERCPTFSTYLARVVRDRVRMVLTKDGPIRLSPSWSRLKRIASVRIPALNTELGRTPSKEEIQADLLHRCMEWAASKLSEEQLLLPADEQKNLMLAKLRKQGMLGAIRDLDDVLLATQSVASLDSPVGDEGGATLGDLLPGQGSGDTFDQLELGELREALGTALANLPDREREIILYRFGFVDGESWTYAKIAEQYGVTAERIRQIERNVLGKLASPHAQQNNLAGFLPSQFSAAGTSESLEVDTKRRFFGR